MQVDVSESGQGGCHAVQFILKSFSFLLELADYRLHQCFWHEASYNSPIGAFQTSLTGFYGLARGCFPGPDS